MRGSRATVYDRRTIARDELPLTRRASRILAIALPLAILAAFARADILAGVAAEGGKRSGVRVWALCGQIDAALPLHQVCEPR